MTKRHFFQRDGVPESWVVDPAARLFEIWHPNDERPRIVDAEFTWKPIESAEALSIDVAQFFASIADGALLTGDLEPG